MALAQRYPVRSTGRRVRSLREARGLSLRDLAAASGVSAPMLSQVERGETSPTLTVAARIAEGLGVSLSQLVRLDEGAYVAVSRRAGRRRDRKGGHTAEDVTPALPGQRAQVSIHTLRPGARTTPARSPHEPGSRETIVVQSGAVDVVLDGDRIALGSGDAVTFDADLAHHFENPSRTDASFVAVVTAGLRAT